MLLSHFGNQKVLPFVENHLSSLFAFAQTCSPSDHHQIFSVWQRGIEKRSRFTAFFVLVNDSTTHPGTQISTQEPSTHNLLSSFRFLKISTLCLFFPHITFLRVCSSPTPALTPFSLGPCVVVAKYQSDLFLPKVSNHSKVPLLWELLK